MTAAQQTNQGPEERETLRACLATLELDFPLGLEDWEPKTPHGLVDANASLVVNGEPIPYAVEIKKFVGPKNLGVLLDLAERIAQEGQRLLLCAPYIGAKTAGPLRDADIDYLDAAGNALIRGERVYIYVSGKRPVKTPNYGAALTATDTRLLGTFLMHEPAAQMLVVELAAMAGIAVGAVGTARKKLAAHGILYAVGRRDWRITNHAKAMAVFAEHWGTRLRAKLKPASYRAVNAEQFGTLLQRLQAAAQDPWQLGGELAAGALTQLLQTEHATLHVPIGLIQQAARALTLVPDEQGPITIMEQFGQLPASKEHFQGLPIAPPLLVWAECLYTQDERARQAADLLRERYLTVGHG